MNAPFSVEQFLAVFAAYNAAIWPAQIAAYALSLLAVAGIARGGPTASRLILASLAILWAWNGIGYHFLFFATINPAAKIFAGFFVLQAILFAASAVAAPSLQFRARPDFRSFSGLACIVYALLIYPVLGIRAGHGLMAGPMPGVAPCPTTIFTIGMLLHARGGPVRWLSVIPVLWSLVGLAAALQLGIPEDFGLPIAGFVLLIMLARTPAGAPRQTSNAVISVK